MKTTILVLGLFFLAFCTLSYLEIIAYSGDIVQDNHADTVISTTTATLVHNVTYGRKTWRLVNTGNYEVRVTTQINTSATTGIPLWPGGHIEDDFYVINSSIYVLAITQPGLVNYSEGW